jgi:hypothetical protein
MATFKRRITPRSKYGSASSWLGWRTNLYLTPFISQLQVSQVLPIYHIYAYVLIRGHTHPNMACSGRGGQEEGRRGMCSHIRSQPQCVPLARHGHSRHTVSIHLSCNSVSDSSHREQLRHNVAHQHKPTALQTVSIVERCTLLLKQINRFREIQEVYMPGVDVQQLSHVACLSPTASVPIEVKGLCSLCHLSSP